MFWLIIYKLYKPYKLSICILCICISCVETQLNVNFVSSFKYLKNLHSILLAYEQQLLTTDSALKFDGTEILAMNAKFHDG